MARNRRDGEYEPEEELRQDEEREEYAPPKREPYSEEALHTQTQLDFLIKGLAEIKPIPYIGSRARLYKHCLNLIEEIIDGLPKSIVACEELLDRRDEILTEADEEASKIIADANRQATGLVSSADARAKALEATTKTNVEAHINEADERARTTIENARNQANEMIDESAIVRAANEKAHEIELKAIAEANDKVYEAQSYANEIYQDLEQSLREALERMQRDRRALHEE